MYTYIETFLDAYEDNDEQTPFNRTTKSSLKLRV